MMHTSVLWLNARLRPFHVARAVASRPVAAPLLHSTLQVIMHFHRLIITYFTIIIGIEPLQEFSKYWLIVFSFVIQMCANSKQYFFATDHTVTVSVEIWRLLGLLLMLGWLLVLVHARKDTRTVGKSLAWLLRCENC